MEHIFKTIDLTLLKPTTTLSDIKKLCDTSYAMGTSSICIPPNFIKDALSYSKSNICTVIGYPYGYTTSTTKLVESAEAVKNGASELDIMINISDVKCGHFDKIENELKSIRDAVGTTTLKAIVSNNYLIREECEILYKIINDCNIDFIHIISNTLSESLLDNIPIIKKNTDIGIGIKISGCINTIEDMENCIEKGAIRLGIDNISQIIT